MDYELSGKVDATVSGQSIDAPDTKGFTGTGELGIVYTPMAVSGLGLDLGVQGYAGKRQGISGSLALKYEF